jgi:hypothetical protein
VQMTLDIPIDNRGVIIPAATLLFPSGKPAIAIVKPNSTVEIRNINITQDLGTRLQVSGDLSEADQLIINPSPSLPNGSRVTVLNPTPTSNKRT